MLKSAKRDVIQTNKDHMSDVQTHLGDSKPLIFPNAIIDINMKQNYYIRPVNTISLHITFSVAMFMCFYMYLTLHT